MHTTLLSLFPILNVGVAKVTTLIISRTVFQSKIKNNIEIIKVSENGGIIYIQLFYLSGRCMWKNAGLLRGLN